MQEFIEWLRRQYEESLNQKNQPPELRRFYDGQSEAFESVLYAARTYIVKEEEVITDAYVAGEEEWITEYEGGRKAYSKRKAYQYYDKTFNTK